MQTISKKLLEVPMNMNPWIIEALVEYERDRIRRDMKQIRLEQEAMLAGRTEEKTTEARFYRPRLLVPTFVKRMFVWAGKLTNTPPRSKSECRASG
jgi:hypothetical protein